MGTRALGSSDEQRKPEKKRNEALVTKFDARHDVVLLFPHARRHPRVQRRSIHGVKRLCNQLARALDDGLPGAESKVWHGGPVWFIEENPIVGYWVRKGSLALLFWSGQSFDEPKLLPEGKFKAAELRLTEDESVGERDLKRWLRKARTIQWDYKNVVKRRGVLEKLGESWLHQSLNPAPLCRCTERQSREPSPT